MISRTGLDSKGPEWLRERREGTREKGMSARDGEFETGERIREPFSCSHHHHSHHHHSHHLIIHPLVNLNLRGSYSF